MVTVVDGLSTLARYGQTVDELEAVPLDAVVADAQRRADAAHVTVTVVDDAAIEADWTRLHELLVSLLDFLGHNGSTEIDITTHDDGFIVATDWTPPARLDDDELFEYTGGLTDTKTGLALPKVRTLARVQGWDVTLERAADGSQIIVDDAIVRNGTE